MADPARQLYAAEIRRHVLALREALVRHDENLAADTLLQECVPHFLLDDPDVVKARKDQRAMVLHIKDPEAYEEYYATNPHERPFEEQYRITPEEAHRYLYRVEFLRQGLKAQCEEAGGIAASLKLIDLSANDGWMAVNLGQLGYTVDCCDLHPGNCELARQRKAAGAAGIGAVKETDLHQLRTSKRYDAVVLFETIEHVADPEATVRALVKLCKPGGRVYVSTPLEAVEQGNVPDWDKVEFKGHVRVFRPQDLAALLNPFGNLLRFEIGPDRVMVAELEPS